ncbi:MAG: hypothetical protein ACI8TQ_001056 [Planctomycetota bacterium]|jgi:hypothetical protein
MQFRNILILLLLVSGLGVLVWMQQEEAASDPDGFVDFAVFSEVDVNRIADIQIEHIERHWQIRLESDARGAWYLTDPIAYAAADGFVKQLFTQFRTLRGVEVVESTNRAMLGLDPPRAVITVTERESGDTESDASNTTPKRMTVEVGAIDLDGVTMYVSVGGRLLRTVRSLDNALQGTLRDFRSNRMTEMSFFERPLEIIRQGSLTTGENDLDFEALFDGASWMATKPTKVALEPTAVQIFSQQMVGARVSRFHDDSPGALEAYGLAEPLLRLELRSVRNNTVAFRFGHPPDDESIWLAKREDFPFIWEVSQRDLRFFTLPFEDLYDYLIIRSNRSAMTSIQLESGGEALRLFRSGTRWVATEDTEVPIEELSEGTLLEVDAGKVGDMLAVLERSEIAVFLDRDQEFIPSDPREIIEVQTEDGSRFGGELGAYFEVQGGERGRMFLRFGDDLVSLVSDELADLAKVSFDSLRSLQIHKLTERKQRVIRLTRGEDQLVYELNRKSNYWQSEGTTLESTKFANQIDRLLSIRARRWLSLVEDPGEEKQAVEVEIESDSREKLRFRLLELVDGTELCEVGGLWAEIRPGLVSGLAGLFASE